MPKTLSNSINIHYQTTGIGPDLVLIHGATGDMAFWYLNILPALMKDFRVTTYDLRGHGYSDMPPTGYTSADMAVDLCGLLDSLGIERAHLLGYSYGGVIALHTAALYHNRVSSLILADSEIPALRHLYDPAEWPHWSAWKEWLRQVGIDIPEDKADDLEYIARSFAAIATDEEASGRLVNVLKQLNIHVPIGYQYSKARKRMGDRLLRLLDNTTLISDIREIGSLTIPSIRQINHPTLAIYGELSPYLKSGYFLRENMPNCGTVIVSRGHFYPAFEPELLVDYVSAFLKDPMGFVSHQPIKDN